MGLAMDPQMLVPESCLVKVSPGLWRLPGEVPATDALMRKLKVAERHVHTWKKIRSPLNCFSKTWTQKTFRRKKW
jgi:hypothetical protein